MIIDPAVRQLIKEYEKAFNALDMEKCAQFFADTFISAGPRGTITQSKAELMKAGRAAAAFYKSVGQQSVRIVSADEVPISDHYTMVRIQWGTTFRKTEEKVVVFDVSYLIQKTGPEPKILLFIAHQDELKAMHDLGLIPGNHPWSDAHPVTSKPK